MVSKLEAQTVAQQAMVEAFEATKVLVRVAPVRLAMMTSCEGRAEG